MDKAKNKQFDKLMERSQELVYKGKHQEALDIFAEAAQLLKNEKETSAEVWAWIYDGQRYSLYELGRFDEAMKVCNQAIEHLGQTTTWAYLSEHSHVRGTLRATHNMMAWILCERAQNLVDAEVALDHIDRCLKTVSPIDGTTLQEFDETHAMVLLKMIEFVPDPAPFQTRLFKVLLKMVRQENADLDSNDKLQSIIKNDAFKAFVAEAPQTKLTSPPQNETAFEAVQRYTRALEYAKQIDEDMGHWFELKEPSPLSQQMIERFEKQIGIAYPPALRRFLLEHGPFKAGSDSSLSIMSGWRDENPSAGLVAYIDNVWGGRPEFEEEYTPEQIDRLNRTAICFSTLYINDDSHEYAFFDQNGKFGTIAYNQDDFPALKEILEPILERSNANQTFDEVVSHQITGLIDLMMKTLDGN